MSLGVFAALVVLFSARCTLLLFVATSLVDLLFVIAYLALLDV